MSVRLKLKISVTAEPIELYSSGNIPTGPLVVLSHFLGEWDSPTPQKTKYMVNNLGFNFLGVLNP